MTAALDFTGGRSDRAKRIAELERRLVDELKPLARVAYNLRWSWIRRGGLVFAEIDPHRWRLAGRNPVRFLFEPELRPPARRRAGPEHRRSA